MRSVKEKDFNSIRPTAFFPALLLFVCVFQAIFFHSSLRAEIAPDWYLSAAYGPTFHSFLSSSSLEEGEVYRSRSITLDRRLFTDEDTNIWLSLGQMNWLDTEQLICSDRANEPCVRWHKRLRSRFIGPLIRRDYYSGRFSLGLGLYLSRNEHLTNHGDEAHNFGLVHADISVRPLQNLTLGWAYRHTLMTELGNEQMIDLGSLSWHLGLAF